MLITDIRKNAIGLAGFLGAIVLAILAAKHWLDDTPTWLIYTLVFICLLLTLYWLFTHKGLINETSKTIREQPFVCAVLATTLLGATFLGSRIWHNSDPPPVTSTVSSPQIAAKPAIPIGTENSKSPMPPQGKSQPHQATKVPKPEKPTETKPPISPSVTQTCANGICIGGENSGTATVYNAAPEPNIDWKIKPSPTNSRRPGLKVTVTVDHSWETPALMVVCDHPCQTWRATILGVYQKYRYLSSPDDPRVQLIVMKRPRPFTPGMEFEWELESNDATPINIVSHKALTPAEVAAIPAESDEEQ